MYQIKRYPILNQLVNHKESIFIPTIIYLTVWSIYIYNNGFTGKLFDDEIKYLLRFFAFPIILICYHSLVNGLLGITWGMWRTGGLSVKEVWWGVLALLPIIGTIPITIRIYQKLVELEKEMKKQGVTKLIYFKQLENNN
jgi:hypothetical protein